MHNLPPELDNELLIQGKNEREALSDEIGHPELRRCSSSQFSLTPRIWKTLLHKMKKGYSSSEMNRILASPLANPSPLPPFTPQKQKKKQKTLTSQKTYSALLSKALNTGLLTNPRVTQAFLIERVVLG
jgi:hypothetical protein